jgi:hypothetical protein
VEEKSTRSAFFLAAAAAEGGASSCSVGCPRTGGLPDEVQRFDESQGGSQGSRRNALGQVERRHCLRGVPASWQGVRVLTMQLPYYGYGFGMYKLWVEACNDGEKGTPPQQRKPARFVLAPNRTPPAVFTAQMYLEDDLSSQAPAIEALKQGKVFGALAQVHCALFQQARAARGLQHAPTQPSGPDALFAMGAETASACVQVRHRPLECRRP